VKHSREEDLHERGVEIRSRLASMADRLIDTATELRVLADNLRAQTPEVPNAQEPQGEVRVDEQ